MAKAVLVVDGHLKAQRAISLTGVVGDQLAARGGLGVLRGSETGRRFDGESEPVRAAVARTFCSTAVSPTTAGVY
jgi:hypothetical protein